MSAKQVSSGYILWKTGPEPVRHSHSGERPAFDCRPHRNCQSTQAASFIRLGIRCRRQYGGEQAPSASAHSKEILGDSVEKIRLPRRCLLQRDSREQCRRRQITPDRSVPKKHLRNSVGKVRLLQAAPVPKKSPGQDRPAALVPKRPPGGSSPQTPVHKNSRKVIGPSGCSVM